MTRLILVILVVLFPVYSAQRRGRVGGYSEKSTNDGEVQRIHNFVLSSSLQATYCSYKLIRARTQVVSGVNYELTYEKTCAGSPQAPQCIVVVWDIPWQNTTTITRNTCTSAVKKRSTELLGGNEEVLLSDLDDLKALNYSIDAINARSNDMNMFCLMKILESSKQIVAGTLYKFTVALGESTYRNTKINKGKGTTLCPLNNSGQTKTCHVEILWQAWSTPEYSLVEKSFKCDKEVGKPTLGGDGHDLCHPTHFKSFKAQFGRSYASTEEEEQRFAVFCDNMAIARRLQETEQGTAMYGPTIFADLTVEEFKQYVGKPWESYKSPVMKQAKIPLGDIPASFDWRTKNAVTEVKNQGSCGSCWAFSTTGNIEGQYAIKYGKLVSLSEQELVDCDKLDEGCNGGLPSLAYEAIKNLGGLETEKDYAYRGVDEKCFFNRSKIAVDVTGSVNISSNEKDMAAWLYQNGPISIGINANAMQFYMGGISHPWKIFCNPKNLDHGVLIVGYGVEGSKPFWIIKNSWGTSWGEKGYYRVYRGDGVCGLNTMCTSALL